jgi:hypothetical protein
MAFEVERDCASRKSNASFFATHILHSGWTGIVTSYHSTMFCGLFGLAPSGFTLADSQSALASRFRYFGYSGGGMEPDTVN